MEENHYKSECARGVSRGRETACGKRKEERSRDPFPRAIGGMSEEAVALGGGNVGGGIAGQVRAHVADLKDGTPAKVALAASQLRVLVGDSAGKVRSWFLLRARCDGSFFHIFPNNCSSSTLPKTKRINKKANLYHDVSFKRASASSPARP